MFNISKSRNGYSHSFISSSVILILMTFLFISFLPEISYSDRIWVSFISAKGGSKNGEEGAPPEISIIESNENHTLVHVSIPGMWVDTVMGPDGFIYQKLEVPDYATTNDVGLPELPAIRGLLGIPDNAEVSMVPEVLATQILDNYYVWPHQRPICDGEIPVFEKNEMFYNSNSWFPLNHNEVGDPGIFKYYTVDNIGYIPFSYNPYLRQLNVSYDYNIDVIYINGGTIPSATMDEDMANLMRGVIWNFDDLHPNIDNYAPVYYLIITPDDYYDEVSNFADYLRTMYSYTVDVVYIYDNFDEYGVKRIIYDYYNTHHSTDYVLLIGDVNVMPTYIYEGGPNQTPSDYWYTLLKGNDLYPELAIGRFSFNSNDVGQLLFQFQKEVDYNNQAWDDDVLLVAHKQEDHPCMSKAANYIAYHIPYNDPKPHFDILYGVLGATNEDVKREINSGMSSVGYLGHGNFWRWNNWNNQNPPLNDWTAMQIYSLENYNKLTVVFNYCCANANFTWDNGNCLCEFWMLGDYNNNRYIGAVATIGHSSWVWFLNSNSDRFNFMEEVYKGIYTAQGAKKGLGWIINMATVDDLKEYFPDPPDYPFAVHNAYVRILLGDPALRMRTGKRYSEIAKNINKPSNVNMLKNIDIRVSNPVYDDINLFISSESDCNIDINIYDISGRLIRSSTSYDIFKGENKITLDSYDMKTGVYLININSDNFNKMLKAVVIK